MKDYDTDKLKVIKELLYYTFPDSQIDEEQIPILKTQNNEQILFGPEKILPYLQTIFFEEHMVELQIDHSTRFFSAHILDDIPFFEERGENGEDVLVDPEYEPGSYLKNAETVLLTPLTPGIGNSLIRSCKQIILRIFMGTVAIELGCTFQKQDSVQEKPVLRINFPIIGRINKTYRPFRVKTTSTIEAYVCVENPDSSSIPEICYEMVDISAMGLAFQVDADKSPYEVGENIKFSVRVKDSNELTICGSVRRITKVRNKQGIKNICGIKFDLETRALAANVEQLTAAIQRLQLRELAEKISDLRGVKLVR
jgi:hypothetical protein